MARCLEDLLPLMRMIADLGMAKESLHLNHPMALGRRTFVSWHYHSIPLEGYGQVHANENLYSKRTPFAGALDSFVRFCSPYACRARTAFLDVDTLSLIFIFRSA